MRRDEKDESGGKDKWREHRLSNPWERGLREESCLEQRVREKEEVEKGEGSVSNGTSPPHQM